jgi:hypothetical protein
MSTTEDRLHAALRTPEPPVADDGFSERVLARLPSKRRVALPARRWTLAAAAGVGSLATILFTPPIEQVFGWLARSSGVPASIFSALVLVAVATVPVAWFLCADREEI